MAHNATMRRFLRYIYRWQQREGRHAPGAWMRGERWLIDYMSERLGEHSLPVRRVAAPGDVASYSWASPSAPSSSRITQSPGGSLSRSLRMSSSACIVKQRCQLASSGSLAS
jgi:hypothetical protein